MWAGTARHPKTPSPIPEQDSEDQSTSKVVTLQRTSAFNPETMSLAKLRTLVTPSVVGAVPSGVGTAPSILGVRGCTGRRARAVRIVGTVAARFESGRLQERLKQLRWRKWLFRGSVLYQMD